MARRKPKKLPVFLDDNEPELLLRATTRERDRMMLLVMLMCGLRVSELTKLQVEHVDFKRGVLWIRDAKGAKDRAGPLPKRLIGPLRGWIAGRITGFVFPSRQGGGRTSDRAVQLLMKRLAIKAGLRDPLQSRRVTPHKFRHAFCTRILDAGVPVHEARDLMGHSSISATDRYAHCTAARLQKAIDAPYR